MCVCVCDRTEINNKKSQIVWTNLNKLFDENNDCQVEDYSNID